MNGEWNVFRVMNGSSKQCGGQRQRSRETYTAFS